MSRRRREALLSDDDLERDTLELVAEEVIPAFAPARSGPESA
jgi:hypothetical protein